MRATVLTVMVVLLPASAVQAQDAAAAQKLFEAMEQKLVKAKVQKFDFAIDVSGAGSCPPAEVRRKPSETTVGVPSRSGANAALMLADCAACPAAGTSAHDARNAATPARICDRQPFTRTRREINTAAC